MRSLAERRKLSETRIRSVAAELYAKMSADERRLVAFGLFPHAAMEAAHEQLVEEFDAVGDDSYNRQNIGRILAVAIMDAAKLA